MRIVLDTNVFISGAFFSGPPADDMFLSCALAGAAEAIVTGDKDLLSLAGSFAIPVFNPRDFCLRFGVR